MLAILAIAALLNGAVVGSVILWRGFAGNNRSAMLLGGLVLVGAAAGTLIVAGGRVGEAAELALTLCAGPLLLAVAWHLLKPPAPRTGLTLALFAETVAILALESMFGTDPIVLAVIGQIGFTLAGWVLFARRATPGQADRRTRSAAGRRAAFAVLAAMSVVHAAQLLRMATAQEARFELIVPLAIATTLLALAGYVVLRSLSASALGAALPDMAAHRSSDDLLARLGTTLGETNLILDPNLRIEGAANAAGTSPKWISEAAALAGYSGFRGFLQAQRIVRAKEILSDPAERRTSIDAIGLGCGFRSRSAFYAAFHRETGMAPGAWRSAASRKYLS